MATMRKRPLRAGELDALVRGAFGPRAATASAAELTDGTYNTAYVVRLTDGREAVLKIAPDPAADVLTYEHDIMRTEVEFYERVRAETTCPVPEVLPPPRHGDRERPPRDPGPQRRRPAGVLPGEAPQRGAPPGAAPDVRWPADARPGLWLHCRVRVGLVGGGWISGSIFAGVAAYPGATVVAVADTDAERRAGWEAAGTPAVADHPRLLDRHSPDVVFVLTPTVAHAPVARDVIAAGVDVVVEKPAATSAAEAFALAAYAREQGRRLLVEESYVFHPPAQAARRLVADGAVGRVRSVAITFYGWRPHPAFAPAVAAADTGWRAEGGFPWMSDHVVHFVALSRALTATPAGEVHGVRALGGPSEKDVAGAAWFCGDVPVSWTWAAVGQEGVAGDRSGVMATVVGTEGWLEVLGEGGAWGDSRSGTVRTSSGHVVDADDEGDILWDADVCYYPAAHRASVAAALDAVASGERAPYEGADGAADLAASEAVLASARGGGVETEPEGPAPSA